MLLIVHIIFLFSLYTGFIVNPSSKIDVIENGLFTTKMVGNKKEVALKFKAGIFFVK